MSVDLGKSSFGFVAGPGAGITTHKMSFGFVAGPGAGVTTNKMSFAVIIDTLTPETAPPIQAIRRRQPMVGTF